MPYDDPKPAGKPGLALLIGRRLNSKLPSSDGDSKPDLDDGGGGDDSSKEDVEDSAIADMMSAAKTGDAQTFKQGLKDFLEACYPELGGG